MLFANKTLKKADTGESVNFVAVSMDMDTVL